MLTLVTINNKLNILFIHLLSSHMLRYSSALYSQSSNMNLSAQFLLSSFKLYVYLCVVQRNLNESPVHCICLQKCIFGQ